MKLTYQPGRAGNHILLFFKPYEVDRFVPGDRYLKRLVRPLYNRLHRRQKVTGFGVSFDLMRRALTGAGFTVHCNDRALARANPDYPVGLVGGRALLAEWRLPNPAILGPSLYDQPGEAPRLFEDPRFHTYVCLSDWTREMFEQGYPGRCASWFAGIDMQAWPDLSGEPKDLDFIIYDKVHWDRRHYEAALIAPIRDELDARGLTHETLRYGEYDHAMFRALLKRARGLVWLSENETQGLAYQEAMASGVPVLAWDRGYWADPQWREHFETPPRASSVPFFSDACGERFACVDEFATRLADFLRRRDAYRPRDFVAQDLSPAASAQLYASAYFAALDGQSPTS
ncbi:MAG TPA: glycosyltransferase [Caulobacteraceae bacterium]|nr:glycosyltransferase [Caulobacteraceae bacterium]